MPAIAPPETDQPEESPTDYVYGSGEDDYVYGAGEDDYVYGGASAMDLVGALLVI